MPKLQIACNTPVAEGMVVHTRNEKVDAGRGMILELLLVNHPLDCPICDKGGECDLQDYAMAYGRGAPTSPIPSNPNPRASISDRRSCSTKSAASSVSAACASTTSSRRKASSWSRIAGTTTSLRPRPATPTSITSPGTSPSSVRSARSPRKRTASNRGRGTCIARRRPARSALSAASSSPTCGSAIVLRTMSVEDDDRYSDGWLCDRGRYNIGFYASPERITQPLYRQDGAFVQIGWDDAFAIWARSIRRAAGATAGAIGGGRLLERRSVSCCSTSFARSACRISTGARGGSVKPRPGRTAEITPRSRTRSTSSSRAQSPAELAPVMWLRAIKAVKRHGATAHLRAPDEAPPKFAHVDVDSAAQAASKIPSDARVALVWDGVDLVARRGARRKRSPRTTWSRISRANSPTRAARKRWACCRPTAVWTSFAMFDAARSGTLAVAFAARRESGAQRADPRARAAPRSRPRDSLW